MESFEQKYKIKIQEFCKSIGCTPSWITFEFHDHDSDDSWGINYTFTVQLEGGGIYQTGLHYSTVEDAIDDLLTIIKEDNQK